MSSHSPVVVGHLNITIFSLPFGLRRSIIAEIDLKHKNYIPYFLGFYRNILGMPWMEHGSNGEILKKIETKRGTDVY